MSTIVISGDTSGSITLQAPAVSGTTTLTLPAATGTVMVSGNMPAFSYQNTTNQNITSTTWTKVTVNSQIFDTNSNVSSSRFTATIAGYYQFNGSIRCAGSSITIIVVALYKNGNIVGYGNSQNTSVSPDNSITVSEVIDLAVNDYVELYGFILGTSPQFAYAAPGANCRFSGAMIRTA